MYLTAVLLVTACGADDAADTTSMSRDEFVAEYQSALCAYAIRCADGPTVARELAPALGARACAEHLVPFVPPPGARFDAARARRCIELLRSVCGAEVYSRVCGQVFRGTASTGATCQGSDVCAAGTECVYDAASPRCPGRCVMSPSARTPLGAECSPAAPPCAEPDDADAWSECIFQMGRGDRCEVVRLGPTASAGAPCGRIRGADGSVRQVTCGAGQACSHPLGGECQPVPAVGESCGACRPGAVCVGGSCQSVTVQPAAAPCDVVGPRQCDPLQRLVCAASTCRPLGDGQAGSRCSYATDDRVAPPFARCARGLFCDPSGFCRAPLPDGAACVGSSDCASGFCTPRSSLAESTCARPQC